MEEQRKPPQSISADVVWTDERASVTDVRFHFRASGLWVTFRLSTGEEHHACISHSDALLLMDPDKWQRMMDAGTALYFKPVNPGRK